IGFSLLMSIIDPVCGQNEDEDQWRKNYYGHGTTHEQMGQAHWTTVNYSVYKPNVMYSQKVIYPAYGLRPLFNMIHYLYENILYNRPAIPSGYIIRQAGDKLQLGNRLQENNWYELLAEYWLIYTWVAFLLILIILMPFIAVCYCCFCFCRRCGRDCPGCNKTRDRRRRMICTLMMLVLIILILCGMIVAFLCNKIFDFGISETKLFMREQNENICAYLNDIYEHIDHLFSTNYDEMKDQMSTEVQEAHRHMFMDLGDTSQANAIEELERIFSNLPEALKLLEQLNKEEKSYRFRISQLRDGLRSTKREMLHFGTQKIDYVFFNNFLHTSLVGICDTMKCLHLDELPRTEFYIKAFKEILKSDALKIIQAALIKLRDLEKYVKQELRTVIPPIIADLRSGRDIFQYHAKKIKKIIQQFVSDIHISTLNSTQSFDDVYKKYGSDWQFIDAFVCVSLAMVLIILIIALIIGFCFSKRNGAKCLLLAIILIFCVFSFIALVGIFYFIMGLLTHAGGCSPRKDGAIKDVDEDVYDRHEPHTMKAARLTLNATIASCEEDITIFQLLQESGQYNVEDLNRIEVFVTPTDHNAIGNLGDGTLLTDDEKEQLNMVVTGNLSSYHSELYMSNLCSDLSIVGVVDLQKRLRALANSMWIPELPVLNRLNHEFRYAYYSNANYLVAYYFSFSQKVLGFENEMKKKLKKIDSLILYNNYDFGKSIDVLLNSILRAEAFIKSRGQDFIKSVIYNLTAYIHLGYNDYLDMIILESRTQVGKCRPLSTVYHHDMDRICNRMVYPINGYWMGLLSCALLLLPLLFVAHRLMCLFRRYTPAVVVTG
ncbi:hypothetical protein KR222_000037, partial [Zaprionus bogoriensis]